MDNEFFMALEAHSEERNHHRRYEVSVGRDLLGHWIVTIRFGRVGTPLRELRFGSPDVKSAHAAVHDRLRRRLSAPRRIGCRYVVRLVSIAPCTKLREWVPSRLLSKLIVGTDSATSFQAPHSKVPWHRAFSN